jgi:small subunit ribosomal protein S9
MTEKIGSYINAVGRRKTSIARVRLYVNKREGFTTMTVNDKPVDVYFQDPEDVNNALASLKHVNIDPAKTSIKVSGGGIHSQADAIALATARAAVKLDENNKPILRAQGLMTRDPRAKERKKPGLKRARRAPQWSKR